MADVFTTDKDGDLICTRCGHLASLHGPQGCTAKKDSAWTPDGTIDCMCSVRIAWGRNDRG